MVGVELDHAVAVVVLVGRTAVVAVAGGGVDVACGVLRDPPGRPVRPLAVAGVHLAGRPPGQAAGSALRVAHHVAVVGTAVAVVAAHGHVHPSVRDQQGAAVLHGQRLVAPGDPRRVAVIRRIDVGLPIHRTGAEAEADQVEVEAGGARLDVGDDVDAAAVDHRGAGDPLGIDVATGDRGGARRPEVGGPQDGPIGGVQRVDGVV